MQIEIAARHGHLGDEEQAEIRRKAEKLIHFFDRITMIEVTVDLKNGEKAVEVKVDAEHKHDFVAQGHNHELKAAVDEAFNKAQHQVHKYKEKVQAHRPAHGGPAE